MAPHVPLTQPTLAEAWPQPGRRRWLGRVCLAGALVLGASWFWEGAAGLQLTAGAWSTVLLLGALLGLAWGTRRWPDRALGWGYGVVVLLVGLRDMHYTSGVEHGAALLSLRLFTAGLGALMLAPSWRWAVGGPVLLIAGPLAWGAAQPSALHLTPEIGGALTAGMVVLGLLAWALARWQAEALAVERQHAYAAAHDGLTGLLKRKAFFDAARAHRGDVLGLVWLDVDLFKDINDRYSHQMGDRVLQELAGLIQAAAPAGALCARLGGEEFAVASPGLDLHGSRLLAQRLRHGATRLPSVPVTLSIGVTVAQPQHPLDDALREADAAMYAAKRGGRNGVRLAGEASWGAR